MCGILGVWDRQKPVTEPQFAAMNACQAHRGPDDTGVFHDGAMHLGHRRLAIIDLSVSGHQPMRSADGRYVLTFNGEIYNYRELVTRYLSEMPLKSNSDTEVLLELLVRQGVAILPQLRGMFAFGLWDHQQQELLLARDPFGKKPLYYHDDTDYFAFASEPKALLSHPSAAHEVDPASVGTYFLHEYVPSPATGFLGIAQVPMGYYMRITSAGSELKPYWQPVFIPKHTSEEDAVVIQLDEKLTTAVQRRLVADVPVGLLLSGGLDSSTIGWYMRQATTAPFHSFSISFDEQSFDESSAARLAARSFGATHHEKLFTVADVIPTVTELIKKIDVPLADVSLLPTYQVSKLAREHVTVVLDGDGSDELFGGYGTFDAARVAAHLKWIEPAVATLLLKLAQVVPTRHNYFSLDFKLKSFLRGLGYPLARQNSLWLGAFSDQELSQLLHQPFGRSTKDLFAQEDELSQQLTELSTTDAISLATIRGYLQNDILVKLDRASMATSLEARTPFLDVDVAEFALKLPEQYKKQKYILKKLMVGRLPQALLERKKQGFTIPLGLWLRGPLHEWARSILSKEALEEAGCIRYTYVDQLLREHREGRADHRKKIWTLLTWELWRRQWINPGVRNTV